MAIDWSIWQHMPKVKLWQAAYLAYDVDPDKKSYDDILNSNKRNSFTRMHDVKASKLLQRLEANIYSEHFTESVQGRYPQSREVRLSEFSAWCLYVGIDIPQELASLAKAVPQTEVVANDGGEKQGGIEPTSSKAIQPNGNEFAFSGLLNIPPRGVDDWFEVIDVMTKAFYDKNNAMPTKAKAWAELCTNTPIGYAIESNNNQSLIMPGVAKAFNKRSFDRRWAKYTAKSNPFKPI